MQPSDGAQLAMLNFEQIDGLGRSNSIWHMKATSDRAFIRNGGPQSVSWYGLDGTNTS